MAATSIAGAGSMTGGRRAIRRSPVLALALLAGACSGSFDLGEVGNTVVSSVDGLFTPFAGTAPVVSDSLTVQRVRGANPEVDPLLPEPGNVWPEGEAPRPTLMSGPDEAMRNIPAYTPSLIDGAPAARSPVPTPGTGVGPRARGTGTPPPPPGPIGDPPRSPVSPGPGVVPPQPRTEGTVMTDPQGRPAIGTGGTGRVQGFTQPGIGGGAVIRDGNVETWVGPDGRTHTRVVPN